MFYNGWLSALWYPSCTAAPAPAAPVKRRSPEEDTRGWDGGLFPALLWYCPAMAWGIVSVLSGGVALPRSCSCWRRWLGVKRFHINKRLATASSLTEGSTWDVGGFHGLPGAEGDERGDATKAERGCRLVLSGERTWSPLEEGILDLWMGGLAGSGGPAEVLQPQSLPHKGPAGPADGVPADGVPHQPGWSSKSKMWFAYKKEETRSFRVLARVLVRLRHGTRLKHRNLLCNLFAGRV